MTIVTNAQCTQLSSKVLPLQDQNSFYTISDLLDHRLWEWPKESRGNYGVFTLAYSGSGTRDWNWDWKIILYNIMQKTFHTTPLGQVSGWGNLQTGFKPIFQHLKSNSEMSCNWFLVTFTIF